MHPTGDETMTPYGNPFFTWSTTKREDGRFSFCVRKCQPTREMNGNGNYCTDRILKAGNGYRTRAQAKSRAVKWARYFRRVSA